MDIVEDSSRKCKITQALLCAFTILIILLSNPLKYLSAA